MATRTPANGPDFSALADILRELFTTLSAPPPKPSKKLLAKGTVTPKADSSPEDEAADDDEEEDALEGMPMPLHPMGAGKPMRRLTISILMPAKGLKPKR